MDQWTFELLLGRYFERKAIKGKYSFGSNHKSKHIFRTVQIRRFQSHFNFLHSATKCERAREGIGQTIMLLKLKSTKAARRTVVRREF